MERQRRQELVARKAAVQASRKMKQSLSVNSSVDTPGERNSISAIATETVEDFLKSLAPVQTKETPTAVILSRKPEEQLLAMDVDQKQVTAQPIPQQQYQKQDPIPVSAVPEQFSVSSVRSYSAEPPPTSVASSTTSFPQLFESAPGTPPIFSSIVTRRGLKRPVASDFVDVDPAPKRHEHSINSIRIQPVLRPMLSMTRRPPSNSCFSNIGSRRCVIDLSDSEDEDEGIREEIPQQPSEDQLKQPKAAAYPSPTPMKPAATSPMSPEVLMQKEMEIRKMRELIAQREEETRLRRLALAKSASASAAANATGTSRSSTPVAQNVVSDVRMASPSPEAGEANGFTTQGSRSSESATPPRMLVPISWRKIIF
ncbi:hypothetical protein CPB84DRAFT_1406601 [Gymnopilus junonius]|uniref:Uncharacterized protein n=1 Tax=Gymnopilus junonius TaxID=109634 RepID=A0A9P5NGM2_GYMJU|nr:hypothetical protein CPB84DRAFT_1406601 [Gymnopilus junonius]